jgi:cell division protein ZapA (FtsZ GTPase activity inhibitor)
LNKTVTLNLFGRKFTFQTDPNDPNAQAVADHFETAVRKVQTQFDGQKVNVDKETVLVLTGLNIASEHFKLEKRYEHLIDRMTEKSAVVLSELEKAIS